MTSVTSKGVVGLLAVRPPLSWKWPRSVRTAMGPFWLPSTWMITALVPLATTWGALEVSVRTPPEEVPPPSLPPPQATRAVVAIDARQAFQVMWYSSGGGPQYANSRRW